MSTVEFLVDVAICNFVSQLSAIVSLPLRFINLLSDKTVNEHKETPERGDLYVYG